MICMIPKAAASSGGVAGSGSSTSGAACLPACLCVDEVIDVSAVKAFILLLNSFLGTREHAG